jgi:Ca2+-binding EF-hand superfamily protein
VNAIRRAAMIVLLTGGLASAEMPLPGAEPLVTGTEGFDALDRDGSGTVSRTEAEALESLHAAFEDHDANGDGELDPEEYQGALAGGIRTAEDDG